MKNAIRCTGYALAGAGIVLGALVVLGCTGAATIYAADVVGGWLDLSKDARGGLGFLFFVMAFGAGMGGFVCREKMREERLYGRSP